MLILAKAAMAMMLGFIFSIITGLVLIPVLKEYGRMLYQKLIYTGVTRSKKKLILLGEKVAFDYAVNNDIHIPLL